LWDCWLPHDAFNGQLSGKNTATVMHELWFSVKRIESLEISQGINAGRSIFPRCWFRASTTQLLTNHLKNYKKKWNDSTWTYTGPKHDEHSHASDAFRYLGVCVREEPPKAKATNVPAGSIISLLD
jgi:phage terminase large subunit